MAAATCRGEAALTRRLQAPAKRRQAAATCRPPAAAKRWSTQRAFAGGIRFRIADWRPRLGRCMLWRAPHFRPELPMPHSFQTSDGVRLAYRIDDFTDPWTTAPIVLLLHAAMGSSKRWYAAVPSLARYYRVVRLDLRGH